MEHIVQIRNLKKSFGRLDVLKGVSCDFPAGKVITILGPNASGKTTLIKSILGMVLPEQGEILFHGRPVTGTVDYKEHIGYMPQIGRYPDHMRIGHLFDMMTDIRRTRTGLDTDLITTFNLRSMYDKPMRTLSGGTRQKVSAALAFLFSPQVLILDEPTAGLDPVAAGQLKRKILDARAAGRLVLITSHILSESEEIADMVMYLCEGRVRFFKPLDQLKAETGESRLGQALTKFLDRSYV